MSPRRPALLLLTGRPGVGKTTLLRRVAAEAPPPLRGFYTAEVRRGGRRVGFRIRAFGGREGWLATTDPGPGPRVGRYRVHRREFEEIALPALAPAPDASYLIDEIGRMECMSPPFVTAVETLLEAGRPVVATVALRGGGFPAAVKSRGELWTVTTANRDGLVADVLAWLAARR